MYSSYVKHIMDFIFSFCALIVLLPVMLIIAIFIKCDSKGEVIFKQKRLGKNQEEFEVYKFRTMVENAYQNGGSKLYEGDPRITKVGSFLRKTSLDELPQLVNILKGEMSLIGPRPILHEEFSPYQLNSLYAQRYIARPGMFCTVDMEYRATASRELQFEMDAEYVKQMSFCLDVRVFIKIFIAVLSRRNIYKVKETTYYEDNKKSGT